eukprot:9495269-Pyramimonas_sp.AAC.1
MAIAIVIIIIIIVFVIIIMNFTSITAAVGRARRHRVFPGIVVGPRARDANPTSPLGREWSKELVLLNLLIPLRGGGSPYPLSLGLEGGFRDPFPPLPFALPSPLPHPSLAVPPPPPPPPPPPLLRYRPRPPPRPPLPPLASSSSSSSFFSSPLHAGPRQVFRKRISRLLFRPVLGA